MKKQSKLTLREKAAIQLAKEALVAWSEHKLSEGAALIICHAMLVPQVILTEKDIEWARLEIVKHNKPAHELILMSNTTKDLSDVGITRIVMPKTGPVEALISIWSKRIAYLTKTACWSKDAARLKEVKRCLRELNRALK